MFRNSEPPVSLFSFQDIITSLTGIMIFFLLLLSLNIIELMQKNQADTPEYQELARAKAKNAVLKNQIAEISRDIANYREKIRSARQQDRSALLIERYRLEKKLRELASRHRELEKRKSEAAERQSQLEKRNRQLAKEKRDLEEHAKQNRSSADSNERLKKQIAELRREIERRRQEVRVTVDSSIRKIPLLLECSVDRIRVVQLQPRSIRVFERKSPISSELANEVAAYLQSFAGEKYYFVFMIKPSAAGYIHYLIRRVQMTIRNADCGLEPIRESETVANE